MVLGTLCCDPYGTELVLSEGEMEVTLGMMLELFMLPMLKPIVDILKTETGLQAVQQVDNRYLCICEMLDNWKDKGHTRLTWIGCA